MIHYFICLGDSLEGCGQPGLWEGDKLKSGEMPSTDWRGRTSAGALHKISGDSGLSFGCGRHLSSLTFSHSRSQQKGHGGHDARVLRGLYVCPLTSFLLVVTVTNRIIDPKGKGVSRGPP